MLVLIGAIPREERRDLLVALRVRTQLRNERRADSRDPLLLGRNSPMPPLEGVAGGAEQQLDRVDERSVEVEEHRGRTREPRHRGMVTRKPSSAETSAAGGSL